MSRKVAAIDGGSGSGAGDWPGAKNLRWAPGGKEAPS